MNKTSKSKAESRFWHSGTGIVHSDSECTAARRTKWDLIQLSSGELPSLVVTCKRCLRQPTDIISRMEAMQQRFGRLQIEDRKPSYWDRIMSDPNRKDRYDDALLEAHMEAQRAFDGGDAEEWQYQSERQGAE